jgi:hypothetical protein
MPPGGPGGFGNAKPVSDLMPPRVVTWRRSTCSARRVDANGRKPVKIRRVGQRGARACVSEFIDDGGPA